MYSYPSWRRVPFIALLLVAIVLNYAPATTQGTATVRLVTLSAPSVITHIYLRLSSVQFHQLGYLNSSGWTTISQAFPIVDLLSPANQAMPPIITSAQIHSTSYDSIRLSFTNSTATISGKQTSLAAPSPLLANMTLPVPPNGFGDLQIIVAFDYSQLFPTQPTQPVLSFVLIRVSSV